MLKVKVRWSGFLGSPGWSNFYFDTGTGDFYTPEQAALATGRVHNFLDAVNQRIPSGVQLAVQSDVEAISPTTGEMMTVHDGGVRPTIVGSAAPAPYSSATGLVITWRTAGVRNGRRVRGRTFLVPLAGGAYDNDGTITAGDIAETQAAATALAADAGGIRLGVWSRPSGPGAADGDWHPIVSASIPDMPAVLRSRRG